MKTGSSQKIQKLSELPHHEEHEGNALGCCLLGDEKLIQQVVEKLITPDFYSTGFQEIFKAIVKLWCVDGILSSELTVYEALKDNGKLESCGGLTLLGNLKNLAIPGSVDYSIEKIKAASELRKVWATSQRLIQAVETGAERSVIENLKDEISGSSFISINEPVPVSKDEVLPFPIEVFPRALQRILNEFSKAVHCPIDFLGVPFLTATGVAIGNTRAIEIKPGWSEGPRLYGGVISEPGSKKSPAINLIMTPIYNIQKRMQGEYAKKRAQYENEISHYETDLLNWRKSNGDCSKPHKPEEPFMKQIFTTDSTLEALAELLDENARGILFVRDELTGWVLSMDQYKGGKGSDRQAWLSFWNKAPVIVNRKNRKSPIILNSPFVGVIGALPPDVLGDLADERGREDGFIHRILFTYPDRKPDAWVEDQVSEESLSELNHIFEELIKLEPERDVDGNQKPKIVSFTPDGKAKWREFINYHYKEQEDSIFPANLRGPWAKFDGYAARLALILHLLRCVCEEAVSEQIDETSMAGAADLIDYFKSHAKRVYAQLHATPEDKRALNSLDWIRKRGGTVTAREVLMYRIGNIKTAEEAKKFLHQLEERGHGKITKGRKGNVTFTVAL